jgi:hypothetical protein
MVESSAQSLAAMHSSAPAATVSDVASESIAPSRDSAIPDFRPRWVRHVAGALTAIAIGAVALAGGMQRNGGAPASAPSNTIGEPLVAASIVSTPFAQAPLPASAAPAEPPPADPALVWLAVRVHPPWAIAFLDNVELTGNPFRAEVPKDSRVHLVRAVAPGFRAAERVVSFAGDVDLDITLKEATPPRVHKTDTSEKAPDAESEPIEKAETAE